MTSAMKSHQAIYRAKTAKGSSIPADALEARSLRIQTSEHNLNQTAPEIGRNMAISLAEHFR